MTETRDEYTPFLGDDGPAYHDVPGPPELRAKASEAKDALLTARGALVHYDRVMSDFLDTLQDALNTEQHARLAAEQDADHWRGRASDLQGQVTALQIQAEQLIVQLAGCSVAALGVSPVALQGDYGWSPAYQDVLDLRARYEALQTQVSQLTEALPPSGDPGGEMATGRLRLTTEHGEVE